MTNGFLLIDPGLKLLRQGEGLHADTYFPRGALCVASYLRARGIDCLVLPLDHYVDATASWEANIARASRAIADALAESKAAMVGISCIFTVQYPLSMHLAQVVKSMRPDVPVTMGGSHTTFRDVACLEECPAIDYVVRGEGEWTVHELFEKVRRREPVVGVKSLTFRQDGAILRTEPRTPGRLDELPMPDYSLLPARFLENIALGVNITASRGCAFKCTYCVEQRFWQNCVRRFPVERIIDEICALARRFENPCFTLEDSMFNINSAYFLEFCERLQAVHPRNFRISYVDTRVDAVDARGLRAMKAAGIEGIIYGIESASERVLARMNKRITLDQARKACRMSTDLGLSTGSFWLVGHPGDSPQEAQKSVDAIEEFYREGLHQAVTVSMFVPYPGTAFFDHPEADGLEILTYDWERWGRFSPERVCQLQGFSASQITATYERVLEIANRYRCIAAFEQVQKTTREIGACRYYKCDVSGYGNPRNWSWVQGALELARVVFPSAFVALVFTNNEVGALVTEDLAHRVDLRPVLDEAAREHGGTVVVEGRCLRWHGMTLTVPHKERMAARVEAVIEAMSGAASARRSQG